MNARAILFAAMCWMVTIGACRAERPPDNVVSPAVGSAIAQEDIALSRQNAIIRAIEKASPAVVNISSTQVVRVRDPFWSWFWGEELVQERRFQSLGSGVIFDATSGYVLTNEHVIEGATYVRVRLQDGRAFEAQIVGLDRVADLAVLKIQAGNLPAAQFGDSDRLRPGEWAIAIGNPFGQYVRDLKPTVTVGVISATHRAVQIQNRSYPDLIQTDAAVNPGNSGGPLVNAQGEVIGVNTFIFTQGGGSNGVNFATPVNVVKVVVQRLIEDGEIREPYLGMQISELDENVAAQLGVEVRGGVVVADVEKGGPADRGGLQPYDVLTEVNGRAIYSGLDALSIVRLVRPGDQIVFTRARKGGATDTVVVTAGPPRRRRN
jgi:S1-C subfamily serine protease